MRETLFILALLLATSASASELMPVHEIVDPSWLVKAAFKIERCTWHFTCYFRKNLGSSLIAITGSTQLSDLDTILTNNNTFFSDTKVNVSSTTWPQLTTAANLTTVGTIASGVWQGTAIDVARQGTGSTSPMANYVILGNGASGFKVVNSLGTSGQFLTSNGAGVAPSWQSSSVNQASNYTWTASNTWSGITNFSGQMNLAAKVGINGVTYTLPTADGSSGQSLVTNGSAVLSFSDIGKSNERVRARRTSQIATTNASSTRVAFDAEDFDPSNRFTTGSGRFQVSDNGWYSIVASVVCSGDNTLTKCVGNVYVNGAATTTPSIDSGIIADSTASYKNIMSGLLHLQAGDTLEIWITTTMGAGSPAICAVAANNCWVYIQKEFDS